MKMSYKQRQLAYCRQILSHKVFNEVSTLYFKYGKMPDKLLIVEIMKNNNLYNINSESTYFRRASTVISWVDWIVNLIK